jgi:hypothetical protein
VKRAPLVALAAIGLFLAAIVAPDRQRLWGDEVHKPVDFTGIDTLVVDLEHSNVDVILARRPPTAGKFAGSDLYKVDVAIRGSTMTLTQATKGFLPIFDLKIVAPIGIRVVEMDDGSVEAKSRIESMEIRGRGAVRWEGDVGSLRLADLKALEPDCATKNRNCGGNLSVERGTIDRVVARTPHGTVSFDHAEDIGEIVLELGDDASYELGGLHGPPPPVTLRNLDGTPRLQPPAEKTAPADGPAEPPRAD